MVMGDCLPIGGIDQISKCFKDDGIQVSHRQRRELYMHIHLYVLYILKCTFLIQLYFQGLPIRFCNILTFFDQ